MGELEVVVVLADSTSYGWLERPEVTGCEVVVRTLPGLRGVSCTSAIACGGSLVKEGTAKEGTAKETVLDQITAWLVAGGESVVPADTAVICRAVPCRQSVPKRSYGEMELARTACGVRETATPIMETCPAAYGAGDKLHFQKGIAATAMESIVEKAVEEMRAEAAAWQEAAARSAATSGAHSAAAAGVAEVAVGKPWVAVVVCCGWNCNKDQGRAEAFVTAELTRCATWGDFVSVASGHAGKQHLKFEWLADRLGAATNHLWQTNKEDHEQAKKNKETLAQTFARSIVLDLECEEEVAALGGGVALQHYRSLNKASHRADFWRYVRLLRQGDTSLGMDAGKGNRDGA